MLREEREKKSEYNVEKKDIGEQAGKKICKLFIVSVIFVICLNMAMFLVNRPSIMEETA